MSTVTNLETYATAMDGSYSRHSNFAGAPLPRIPRSRSSPRSVIMATGSTSMLSSMASTPASPPATIQRVVSADSPLVPPAVLVIHPPTPPRLSGSPNAPAAPEAASSSSSGSEEDNYVQMNPRVKRVRTPKMHPFRSAADSTPTPAVFQAQAEAKKGVAFPACADGNDTPRASGSSSASNREILANLDAFKITAPEASTSNLSVQRGETGRIVSAPQPWDGTRVRKKSGEPLKSSLKSRRPVVRGDLSVVTGGMAIKSEPATPTAIKSVKFDAHLEHVKLFIAEQKPLAISREGSPTDTSGTESDFPSAIYGAKKESEEKELTMRLTNKPAIPPTRADIALEDLTLAADGVSLTGRIRVRNLAFEKWVAVRFTLDDWQTTSEVTAKYLDSLPGGVFDRFTFTIRLNDLLARIEDKTLFFALRYNVAGREIWDNNAQQNYRVQFTRVARPRAQQDLASLKSKLETVAKGGKDAVGAFIAQGARKQSQQQQAPFKLGAKTSLSARYDFAASLKNPWARPASPALPSPTRTPTAAVAPSHARTATYPAAFGARAASRSFEDALSHAALARGSPRLGDPDSPAALGASPAAFRSPSPASAPRELLDDTPVAALSRRRNHQRGYFELGRAQAQGEMGAKGGAVRMTPPSTPVSAAPRQTLAVTAAADARWFAGSEESTPSATSSSSSSRSGSPTEEFMYGLSEMKSPDNESYSSFLDKYCYFTGPTSAPEDAIQRSHSASSVEEFLSASPGPSYMLSPGDTPTRSSSFDDVVGISSGGSGASTPTPTFRETMTVR